MANEMRNTTIVMYATMMITMSEWKFSGYNGDDLSFIYLVLLIPSPMKLTSSKLPRLMSELSRHKFQMKRTPDLPPPRQTVTHIPDLDPYSLSHSGNVFKSPRKDML